MPQDNNNKKDPNKKPPSMMEKAFKIAVVAGVMSYTYQYLPGNDEKKPETPDTIMDVDSYDRGYTRSTDVHITSQTITTKSGKHIALIDYDSFKNLLFAKTIADITFGRDGANEIMYGKTNKNTDYAVISIGDKDPYLYEDIERSGASYRNELIPKPPGPTWGDYAKFIGMQYGPTILIIAVIIFMVMRMQGGKNPMGKSKAKMLEDDQKKVTFDDVAGVDEAKEEVKEMVDFLKDPEKYIKQGANVPRGALMVGPPGTGKTLLARAIAGEADVPFFTNSGSDFVEMFVGVGASRVRDLFDKAKKHAPCIIFIDEVDAVGRARGNSNGGGNDEREQTLNQLLVEMDGFEENESIIVIAATNRAEILDKALLRPGRFDREINVGLPDVRGREQILKVHAKKLTMANDVELKYIAQGTPGMSGADLANLLNEAVLFSIKDGDKKVSMHHIEKAKDKIIMGVERKSMIMDDDEKRATAYHEAGHAIVGKLTPEHDPVYKVSIMPRGRALGITMFLPEKDQYSASKRKLNSMISTMYGGRVAEEMLSEIDGVEDEGNVTTGASNDIERATELANNMVAKWGLSDAGKIDLAPDSEKFGGKSVSQTIQDNPKLEKIRDAILDKNYERAETILEENLSILHNMAEALMKWETIGKPQIEALMKRKTIDDIPEPAGYSSDNDNNKDGGKPTKTAFLALPPPSQFKM